MNVLIKIKISACLEEINFQLKKGKTQTHVRFFELEDLSDLKELIDIQLENQEFHYNVDNLGIITAWLN